ncbi:hypothetical protein BV20DRAFT_651720 [Pilatotrama ljubarskyi]|nr:hypothetical protein BV20DRAFT_651720 [Pilatotrama ljubarskyi]
MCSPPTQRTGCINHRVSVRPSPTYSPLVSIHPFSALHYLVFPQRRTLSSRFSIICIAMSSSSGNAPSGGRIPFDPSLLQPIVRSKRTPMACLECRRRQVKCSGTTPRCERCQKKGIECQYMSLSEQRSATGGSISRMGTPQAAHGATGQTQVQARQQESRLVSQAQWAQGTQGYPAGTTYATVTPQGWRASTSAQGGSAGQYPQQVQTPQGHANVQMGYPQVHAQQAAYAHAQGVASIPGGAEMYTQAYGVTAQQGYASDTYNAYGHVLPSTDPEYVYQAAQAAGAPGGEQA